ncbi:MAG TPA: BolA/IbaG family iron-sulfur metabolism protein [Gammaproteobacteria bacterium]|nr:BolA/IbaG family iron-sulfur metabolism protein [Gammaproteobacteria bacterium]
MNRAELENLLTGSFSEAEVAVATADGVHFSARIVTPRFAGHPRLARHREVYAALGERMGGEIHALTLETLTPEEARERA